MELFVLDTNVFFNFEEIKDLGKNTTELIKNLLPLIERLKKEKKADFFMPVSAYKEFLSFFEEETEEIKKLSTLINIQNPERESVSIPGSILHFVISEFRKRSHLGMKVAEEEIIKASSFFLNKQPLDKKSFQKSLQPFINKLRQRYRNALRTGFIDSSADVDVLLLSKQLNAFLITTDQGIITLAEKLGIKILPAKLLKKKLLSLI